MEVNWEITRTYERIKKKKSYFIFKYSVAHEVTNRTGQNNSKIMVPENYANKFNENKNKMR